jgi:hypothetical protein
MARKVKVCKELQPIRDAAIKQGWTIEIRNNSHMKWVSPEGKQFFTAATPSDRRGIKNHISMLKQAGLVLA